MSFIIMRNLNPVDPDKPDSKDFGPRFEIAAVIDESRPAEALGKLLQQIRAYGRNNVRLVRDIEVDLQETLTFAPQRELVIPAFCFPAEVLTAKPVEKTLLKSRAKREAGQKSAGEEIETLPAPASKPVTEAKPKTKGMF